MSEALGQIAGALLNAGGPLLGLAGVLVIGIRLLYDRFLGNRKVLIWEVVSDSGLRLVPDEPNDFESFSPQTQAELEIASIVILKFRNTGTSHLEPADFDEQHPLTFSFSGRSINSCRVSTTDSSPDVLEQEIQEEIKRIEAGRRAKGSSHKAQVWDSLVIPAMELNRGDYFKLIVILAGTTQGVEREGRLRNTWKVNRIIREPGSTWFRGKAMRVGLALLLVGVTLTLIGVTASVLRTPAICGSGELTVKGSSAFGPVVDKIGKSYTGSCSQAKITMQANGSLDGIRQLRAANANQRSTLAVLSDGKAVEGADGLDQRPVAVIIYSVVTNVDVGIDNLRLDQLRDIYRGRYKNWRELGSPIDLPIRLIGRGGESGTRRTFEQQVLGFQEGPLSSDSCKRQDRDPAAAISLCERDTTQQVLDEVVSTPGGLGYVDAPAGAKRGGVTRVRIDGNEPTLDHVRRGYPFWTVEYLYTNGIPDQTSVLGKFIDYLISDSARVKLREAEYTPCIEQDRSILDLCQHPTHS